MTRLPGRSIRDSYRIRVSRRERLARAREHRAELWPADPPCLYPTREADEMAEQDKPPTLIPARPPRPPHRPG